MNEGYFESNKMTLLKRCIYMKLVHDSEDLHAEEMRLNGIVDEKDSFHVSNGLKDGLTKFAYGAGGLGAALLVFSIPIAFESTHGGDYITSRIADTMLKAGLGGLGVGSVSIFSEFLAYGIEYINEKVADHYANRAERVSNLADQGEKIVAFIDDLKDNVDDDSLNFARVFLDKCNIHENSTQYNLQLLNRLSDHRLAVKNTMSTGDDSLEHEQFEKLVHFIRKSSVSTGASVQFLDSPYIEDLAVNKIEDSYDRSK